MNGIELCRKIKEMSSGKSLVIMISGARWESIEAEAREAGVDKFLTKPIFPSSVIEVINECLDDNKMKHIKVDYIETKKRIFESHTMLLADDVDINREIVVTLLEPTGLEIECAENGREAVDKFTANPDKYDIILMDIQMPEMDGYEATRQIRALEAKLKSERQQEQVRGVPIVAMTANVFKEDVEKCLDSGMNDHLGKPLDIDDVMAKLEKYLIRK